MTSIKEERNRLRAEAKAARAAMEAPYRAHKSAELCLRLVETLELTLGITGTAPEDFTVAVYSAFPEEVDLTDFINAAYARGVKVAFPCMVKDAHGIPDAPGRGMREAGAPADAPHTTQQTMEMRAVSQQQFAAHEVPFLNNPLKSYHHSDAELEDLPYVPANELNLLIVPVVGFDAQGNRLGYGAGNYDRYLSQVPETCRVAGVAFAEQQVDPIPTEPHDIPLAIVSL